jgi:hypothetical protein
MLQNKPTLKSKIDQSWDKFWSGGISKGTGNPAAGVAQAKTPATRT